MANTPEQTRSRWPAMERIVSRFEDALRSGKETDIEGFLDAKEVDRGSLLVELVHVDLEHRLSAGQAARVEQYLQRFPELAGDETIKIELLKTEYKLRRRREKDLSVQEYVERFPEFSKRLLAGQKNKLDALTDTQTRALDDSSQQATDRNTKALEPNHTFGKFKILGTLGKGAFGTVYRAYDPMLEREVALKVPHPGALESDIDKARYLREPKAAAQLRHPNIVPLYDAAVEGDNLYLASAYIEGQTLQAAIRDRQPDFRRAATLVMKLAAALDYAHRQGIVHRDIKPANLMLDGGDEPLLMDFGLAKMQESAGELTHDGTIMGTPAYMSPEQAAGKQDLIGPAADQYSLGVVFYELLCGQRPFSGPVSLVLSQVQNQQPPSPASHNDKIPKDLETICLKAIEKELPKRYASCQDLADDLRRWLEDEPIHARRLSLTERTTRWCRRNPAIAGLMVAVCFVFLVGFSLTTWQWRVANSERKNADTSAAKANAAKKQSDKNAKHAIAKQEELRRQLYATHMNLAAKAWDSSLVGRVLDLLDLHRPKVGEEDLRGFEWHYLNRLCHSGYRTLNVPDRFFPIGVVYSPDGLRTALASRDDANCCTIKVWDATTDQEVCSFQEHAQGTIKAFFSPDGRHLAISTFEKNQTLRVWNAETGQLLHTLSGHAAFITCVAFSSDSSRLASTSNDKTVIWDATTGKELFSLDEGTRKGGGGVTFSPDGLKLASVSSYGDIKLWNATTGQQLLALKGHAGVVWSVAFSPDGQRLASAGSDRIVKLWDATTGKELFTLVGHTSRVKDVAFSHNGFRLVSAGSDRMVKLWDATTGILLLSLKGHVNRVENVAFSPDDSQLISHSYRRIKLWDARTDKALLTLKGHVNSVSSVAYSPDGLRLATASNGEMVKMWDAKTGQELFAIKEDGSSITCVTFSPDGQRLATASRNKTVRLWDANTGKALLTLKGHARTVWSVTFSPDGQRLASAGSDRMVRVWDATTGHEVLAFTEGGNVTRLAFSPDGVRLASGCLSRNTVKVWNAETGQVLHTLDSCTRGISGMDFSLDGRRLASICLGGVIKVWKVETGQLLCTFGGSRCVAFSPDGQQLATVYGNTGVKVLDSTTGQVICTFKGRANFRGRTNYVRALAFSPNGKQLVTGSDDQTVKLYDITTGRVFPNIKMHDNTVQSVAFSSDGSQLVPSNKGITAKVMGPILHKLNRHTARIYDVEYSSDGSRLASVSTNETIVWDVETGQELFTTKGDRGGRFENVTFSPDGQRLAMLDGLTVKLWDATTGQELLTLRKKKGSDFFVHNLAFSPDGRKLAGAYASGTILLWDTTTGQQLFALKGHTSGVNRVVFSPIENRLASASNDDTVKLWDTTTGMVVFTFKGHSKAVYSVAFSPDGNRLASSGGDKTVRIWDARPLEDMKE